MPLIDMLRQQIAQWEMLGHPALLERFILRNGKPYTPRKRIGTKRAAKQCFANAVSFVFRHREATYVEGFVVSTNVPYWPIHHAWVTMGGNDAMDQTLDAEGNEYFGVAIDRAALHRELLLNKVYGILDPGLGLNTRFMFAIDPALEKVCRDVSAKRPRETV